ncbi:hypothetical protein FB451DRAFT_1266546 [Mycena latifolia]|nr:hypothetical protein FB451DRAFT_1266546 [Mycena latifolia]
MLLFKPSNSPQVGRSSRSSNARRASRDNPRAYNTPRTRGASLPTRHAVVSVPCLSMRGSARWYVYLAVSRTVTVLFMRVPRAVPKAHHISNERSKQDGGRRTHLQAHTRPHRKPPLLRALRANRASRGRAPRQTCARVSRRPCRRRLREGKEGGRGGKERAVCRLR